MILVLLGMFFASAGLCGFLSQMHGGRPQKHQTMAPVLRHKEAETTFHILDLHPEATCEGTMAECATDRMEACDETLERVGAASGGIGESGFYLPPGRRSLMSNSNFSLSNTWPAGC